MLYKLDTENITNSRHAKIARLADFGLDEKDLENFLRSRLTEVISEEHLMLIGQERPFQEEADLLALGKDGELYIFELKRWRATSENLLQVLRYGQIFGRYTYEELENLARRHGNLDGSLRRRHADLFGISPLEESDFNRDQVFVLITNGADEDTISAINYWSGRGLKVVCVPYGVYDIDDAPYLRLHPYNPAGEVVVERETNYFVVNTNRRYMPGVWRGMLGDRVTGKAAAYYDRKGAIRRIPEEAVVFLYHNRVGIIARGTSTSPFQSRCFNGDKDAEFYVPLRFKWALKRKKWRKAPTAGQISRRLGRRQIFMRTVFEISKEMADAIDQVAQENGAVE